MSVNFQSHICLLIVISDLKIFPSENLLYVKLLSGIWLEFNTTYFMPIIIILITLCIYLSYKVSTVL